MENLQVARCFSILDGRSRSYVLEACRPLQLTYSEYVLLLRLFDCEGASQKDTEDRRIKRIRLTEYGRMQHPFLLSVMNSWVNYLIDTLSPQDVSCVERNFRILAERSSKADFRKLIGKMAR